MEHDDGLSPAELALLLGATEEAVIAWVEHGLIPYRHVGEEIRFDRRALDRWIEERARDLFGDDF